MKLSQFKLKPTSFSKEHQRLHTLQQRSMEGAVPPVQVDKDMQLYNALNEAQLL
jgi:hypothetical protein